MADLIVAALVAERHRRRIRQSEVLETLGGSQALLSRQETGDANMSTERAAAYARVLGLRFVLVPIEKVDIPDPVVLDAARAFIDAIGGIGRIAAQDGAS